MKSATGPSETKSTHINFTYQKVNNMTININSQKIQYANTAKYLGMTLDTKFKWKEHVKTKKEELNIKFRKMNWLLGRHSELTSFGAAQKNQMHR